MSLGLVIPFALEVARPNPLREATRNLVINRGDDVTLAVSTYTEDGQPVDISGGAIVATVYRMPHHSGWWNDYAWHDYGLGWWTYRQHVVFTAEGFMRDAQTGRAEVIIPHWHTAHWHGAHGLLLTLDSAGGGASVLSQGVLDVRHGPVRRRLDLPAYVTVSQGQVIMTEGDFSAADFDAEFNVASSFAGE